MDSTDLVRLSVPCPELDVPITIPLTMVLELNAERLLSEIERVLQSYEQFVLDETQLIQAYHQIRRGFAPGFVNYKKECTRLAAASDKVYQLLAMVGGSLRVLRLLPPLKLVAMI